MRCSGSAMKRARAGSDFAGWAEPSDSAPERIGDPRSGSTPYEAAHGLNRPINVYPLFENALRARDGRGIEEHQRQLGKLFAPFTEVADKNPEAWFPIARSAEELVTTDDRNRMIGFPYPKYLNAIMEVDQSAGVLIARSARRTPARRGQSGSTFRPRARRSCASWLQILRPLSCARRAQNRCSK